MGGIRFEGIKKSLEKPLSQRELFEPLFPFDKLRVTGCHFPKKRPPVFREP
jgi:hypothetical protein